MAAVNQNLLPLWRVFPSLVAFMLAGLLMPPAALGQRPQAVAALSSDRPSSALPAAFEPGPTGRAAEIKSAAEALVLLYKLEAQLRMAPERRVDAMVMKGQVEQAGQFLRKVRARRMRSARYQWHRVSRIRPEAGARRLILRPLHPVPSVSVIHLDVSGGPVRVNVIRAYGATGVVYEFHPRQIAGSADSSEGSRFCLDGEIELTAVEVFCEPIAREGLDIGVQGGIAIEPAPLAENYCLRALQLAQAEIQRNRFDVAARHIHNSIDLLKQVR